MAVAFDASSESHTGTTGATTGFTFSWTHTPVATPSGVLVFTLRNTSNNNTQSVYYGDYPLSAVSGARATDTSGETSDCRAWVLSSVVHGPFKLPAAATSNTANNLQAVAYGNGYWVAVGNGGTIVYRSADPAGSWSAATSGTADNLFGVCYDNGYWVAVGAGGTIVYKATNPTGSWSAATSGTANQLEAVTYGGGNWVAVGASGTIRYKATDPTGSWSSSTSNTTNSLLAVTYGGGNWVAGGASTTARYTTDLTATWSTATTGGSLTINGLTYNNGYWVAATSSNFRHTNDLTAASWTTITLPTGSNDNNGLNCIAFDGSYFLSAGANGVMKYVPADLTFSTVGYAQGNTANALQGIAHGGGYWTAVGDSGTIVYFTNTDNGPISMPTGAQTVTVRDAALSQEAYAVAITVTASNPVEATGPVLLQEDGTLAEQNVDDGSPGTNSMRFAAVNSGLADVPAAGANSTALQSIDFGQQIIAVVRETTAGQGSRSVGFSSGTSDDRAAVHLAIREAIVPWTVGVPIR